MATSAVARETVFALRRELARIEGVLPERLETPDQPLPEDDGEAGIVLRRAGVPGTATAFLRTGVNRFDAALGGGLPYAGLTEIHGRETRDAGAAAGFVLALARLACKGRAAMAPLLWIGVADIFHEAGAPYAPGLLQRFGISADSLLFSEVRKLEDALWVAEEAAGLASLSAVILEIRGHARKLDLTATRRLHRRAQVAGRPLYLMRQAAGYEPTAAPVRLVVSPAQAAERRMLSGALAGSIGPPAFTVDIARSRLAIPARFTLEWNADERAFHERRPDGQSCAYGTQDHGAVVSASADRADLAAEAGQVVALKGAA